MLRDVRDRLSLLGIFLAGMALRLFRLGADSLWYDETVSVALAGNSLPELLRRTAGDIHPPGYYILLRGWLILTGYPAGHAAPLGIGLEFSAGFFSLFFGVSLIALVYALARRAAGRTPALIAAALVAVSPYNIWYSQEVRMYTLAAGLGAVATYALLHAADGRWPIADSGRRKDIWWPIYALAAAAGMYTLYYFVFLLIPLNLWALWRIAHGRWHLAAKRDGSSLLAAETQSPRAPTTSFQLPASRPRLPAWLLANGLAALLYAPWVPVAWRQATNPPVPPWRTAPSILSALRESWTALSLGQSAPGWLGPVLLLTLGLYGLGLLAIRQRACGKWLAAYGKSPMANSSEAWQTADDAQSTTSHRPSAISHLLLLATFGPLALILLVSLVTPLYHVRYLFTYSPAFFVMIAAGLAWCLRRSRLVFTAAALIWLAAAGVTLPAFWAEPAFRADDHRAAVRFLAKHWRPGDVVVVNAGWPYTALTTYWDRPIASRTRLNEPLPAAPPAPDGLVMVTTGHVDGASGLGWDDPRSDFFAMPADAAQAQLAALFKRFDRVWHYRIYDTVNDPDGRIRAWLAEDGQLFEDRTFTGEANMRVQGFIPQVARPAESSWHSVSFAPGLSLRVSPLPATIASGGMLYPVLAWQPAAPQADFAVSIRLIGPDGAIWAQPPDELPAGPLLPVSRWPIGETMRQTLALLIPDGTPPGAYAVELVVYDPVTGETHLPSGSELPATANGVSLGSITVERPAPASPLRPAMGRFGPLALVEADSPATAVGLGGQIPVELLWQAPTAPEEAFVVVVQLIGPGGQVVAGLEAEPVGGRYPTQAWAPGELVRDRHVLSTPADLPAGTYSLIIGLRQALNGSRLTVPAGLFGRSDHVVVKEIVIR